MCFADNHLNSNEEFELFMNGQKSQMPRKRRLGFLFQDSFEKSDWRICYHVSDTTDMKDEGQTNRYQNPRSSSK